MINKTGLLNSDKDENHILHIVYRLYDKVDFHLKPDLNLGQATQFGCAFIDSMKIRDIISPVMPIYAFVNQVQNHLFFSQLCTVSQMAMLQNRIYLLVCSESHEPAGNHIYHHRYFSNTTSSLSGNLKGTSIWFPLLCFCMGCSFQCPPVPTTIYGTSCFFSPSSSSRVNLW